MNTWRPSVPITLTKAPRRTAWDAHKIATPRDEAATVDLKHVAARENLEDLVICAAMQRRPKAGRFGRLDHVNGEPSGVAWSRACTVRPSIGMRIIDSSRSGLAVQAFRILDAVISVSLLLQQAQASSMSSCCLPCRSKVG
jgi:hypothetical protein